MLEIKQVQRRSSVSRWDILSQICRECEQGGGCCFDARPPLTQERIDTLLARGFGPEDIEFGRYKRLKVKEDGYCVMFQDGRCKIHSFKPETCVAGPFTFDVKGSILEIYMKKEGICPLVRHLKEDLSLYNELFDLSVSKIVELVEKLPPEELEEILKIEERETELVAEIRIKRSLCLLERSTSTP
jgi:Fe-S-cluster containining protein